MHGLADNVITLLQAAEVDLGALLGESEPPVEQLQALVTNINEALQLACGSWMENEDEQSMAWIDLISLCCANLDYLDYESLTVDDLIDRLGSLLLLLAVNPLSEVVESLMDWLQAEGQIELLDQDERERIAGVLGQSAETPVEPELMAEEPQEAAFALPEVDEEVESNELPVDAHAASPTASAIDLNDDQIEILGLIASELEDMEGQQTELLDSLEDGQAISKEHINLFNSIGSRYEHLVNVCAMVDLSGLQGYFKHLQDNYEALTTAQTWQSGVAELFVASLSLGRSYVAGHLDPAIAVSIVALWVKSEWPLPIAPEYIEEASNSLLNPDMGDLDDDRGPRQTVATAEDVSLLVPDDVNQDLLESLLQELPDQTSELSASLQSCIKNQFISDLDAARRIAHTVKGAANVVGIRGIANLTHHMEDMLDFLAKYNKTPTGNMGEMLLAAADCLEAMCDVLLGQGDAPDDAQMVLQQVLDWANRLDEEGTDALEAMEKAPMQRPPAAAPVATDSSAEKEAEPAKQEREKQTEEQRSLRISYSLIDDLMRLAGEHTILSGQIQEHSGNALKHMGNVKHRSHYLRSLAQELEQLVDVRRVGIEKQKEEEDDLLDPLELEEYNELHTVTHRLVEAVNDVYEHLSTIERELFKLSDANVDQGRMNSQQQEAVMQTRMVPVQSVVPRLQRSVRQACRLAGKQVELEVDGSATLIDNDILSSLIDPIMHLLRNAVDHGIEDLEGRVEAGKPDVGVVNLSFSRRGDQILVRCNDDGRGLNYARIQEKGIAAGLIQEGVEYTQDELAHLILTPGFSTSDVVTQLSGRGVGMDVVNSQVEQLKGVLTVSSEPGNGCYFEIVLPTSLLAAHALLVQAGQQTFVVTSHGVDEILFADAGEVSLVGDELVYTVGNNAHKVMTLAALLNIPSKELPLDEPCILMLVETALGRRVAVMVDRVIDSRDIVIKPLGHYLPKIPGVVGATILGDGSAVAVLDLPGLARTEHAGSTAWQSGNVEVDQDTASILVVDDSLSTRRSLAQFVEDMGIEVETAKDGMDAIECIRRKRPSLVLADLEMPRMNGLELTSHIRSQSETEHIPVIMITSRATDKHRKLAEEAGVTEYLNKPYSEEQLLQCIHANLQAHS